MKVKLTNKNGTYYRLRVLEPTPSILNAIRDYWVQNNIDTNVYGEWDKVSVEIEGIPNYTPKLIYYLDEYRRIPYEFTSNELKDIQHYLDKNLNKYPDNYVLGLGDSEYEEMVDTIDERHKVDLAVALKIALDIINLEEFELKTQMITEQDYKYGKDIYEDEIGNISFVLEDMLEANLGGIENETFYSLADIINRMDTYHIDYLYRPFEERRNADIVNGKTPADLSNGREIKKGDWDSAILYLLNSDKFTELLGEITPDNYFELIELCHKVSEHLPMGYNKNNVVEYMTDKLISESIIESQSAYVMAEKDDKVYLSYYGFGDEFSNSSSYLAKQELLNMVEKEIKDFADNDLFCVFDNYKEVIESEKEQIIEDVKDLGIDKHYLNEYAFCYLGMEDIYDNALDAINNQLSFIDDKAKMYDFTRLSKCEFLKSYSYLDEKEYDATRYVYDNKSKEERKKIDNITVADVKEYESNELTEPDIIDD